jgi:hypothetical protein
MDLQGKYPNVWMASCTRVLTLETPTDPSMKTDSSPDPGVDEPAQGAPASLLDPDGVLAVCDRDAECLRALCSDFQVYAPRRLAEIVGARRNGDAPRLREAAHKFFGLLAAFSKTAGAVASDLEDRAARGELDGAGPLIVRLEAMVPKLLDEVGNLSYEGLERASRKAGKSRRAAKK